MVEILKMLGEYLKKKTTLPYDIQPTPATPAEPHLVITPNNLDIQTLHTLDIDNQLNLIGIELLIELQAQGSTLEFLNAIFNASIIVNELFGEYFNVTLDKTALGFSVSVEKTKKGNFTPIQQGEYPYKYNEGWRAMILLKRKRSLYE